MRVQLHHGLLGAAVLLVLAAVHGQASAQWLSPGALSTAHAGLDGDQHCASCHASGSRVSEPACLHCHADIARQGVRAAGLHGASFVGQACVKCHVEHLGEPSALIRWPGPDARRFDHARTALPLRGAHADLACARCHDRDNERGHATYLGLETRCASCHEDPHAGRLGPQCQQCHDETRFGRLELGSFDHARARFPLDGQHARVPCAKCHADPPRYRGLAFSDCDSCHQDPHAGRLSAGCKHCHEARSWTSIIMPRLSHPGLSLGGGHEQVSCERCHDAGRQRLPSAGKRCVDCHAPIHEAAFGERCDACHADIRWLGLPAALGRKLHGLTAFPLRGAHTGAPCAGCHLPELPSALRFRRVDHARCAACHVDAHGGGLRARGDCATCHGETQFAPSNVSPEIHAGFGFPLEGAHAATACSGCHRHEARPRTRWGTDRRTCQSCHENPHGSRFAQELAAKGCGGCHGSRNWSVLGFDHAVWPLTGAHAEAGCAACHGPTTQPRAAPRRCEGCHDDVHAGQFRLSGALRTCDACHGTAAFTLPRFDHAQVAGYALTGKHAAAPCAKCHPSVQLHDGERAQLFRLGYSACADCHADPHSDPGAAR